MITISFSNGKKYLLKNRWEELSPEEFKLILSYITRFMNSEITLQTFRIMVFMLVSGEKFRLHPDPEKSDRQIENMMRIAHQMVFPLRINYENDKAFQKLKKEVRESLTRYLPEELPETPEIRWAARANKTIRPDLVFAKNLIPTIGRRRHKFTGYTFELNDQILITSLTTQQFIDAQMVAAEIHETGNESLLNMLVAILYPGNHYSALQAAQTAKTLAWLDMETKQAIFINFNAIQSFLTTRTKYAILFNEPTTAKAPEKHRLGLGSVAYSLIKSGYTNIEESNLVKFFEIMYCDLVSNVKSLHRQGTAIDKISELTGLSMSKINQII